MKLVILLLIIIFLIINVNKEKETFNFSNSSNTQIFCINLNSAHKRWESVKKKFNKLNLNIIRFPAVDGRKLDINNLDTKKILKTYNTNTNALCDKNIKPNLILKLSGGEVGCSLSHLGLWEKIVKENITRCIIIEDDINPLNKFTKYNKYIDKLPSNWDLAYVSFLNTGKKKYVSESIYIPLCGFTTCGYILNLKGAKKLLSCLPIKGPIDLFLLSLFREKKINCYVIEGLCDSSQTWGGNDSQIEHSTRYINKYKSTEDKKVIVIGNGKYEKENMSKYINKYDIVVRFNNYPINNYNQHIGSKTDMWFISGATYLKNKKLVKARKDKIKTKYIVSPDFYKDEYYSINDKEFNKILEKKDILIPQKYDFGKKWPSTGILALFYLIPKYNDITIFGFNSFDPNQKSIHFYESLKSYGHSSNLEKQIINDLIISKKIKRL